LEIVESAASIEERKTGVDAVVAVEGGRALVEAEILGSRSVEGGKKTEFGPFVIGGGGLLVQNGILDSSVMLIGVVEATVEGHPQGVLGKERERR